MRSVDRIQDLNAIFDDDVDAVIWRRSTPSSVGAQLSVPRSEEMEGGLFEAAPGDVGACIKDLFVSWGWAIGPAQRWLADDAESLAVQLAQILSTSRVRLRAEWVRDDACRKFHRDWVRARLICTYCGPGTEYGPADGGDRPSHVDRVPTGAPIVLKGKLWSQSDDRTILHRSPPIEEAGSSRLVVVLDEAPT